LIFAAICGLMIAGQGDETHRQPLVDLDLVVVTFLHADQLLGVEARFDGNDQLGARFELLDQGGGISWAAAVTMMPS
jgi:hypothetical protein